MRAVVLVGGFGTRLRPLTLHTPKPMLPVGHRPIVEHLVTELAEAGVTEVILALGFKPEPFVEAFPDGRCAGVALHYAVEPEPLDTAGAIRFAALDAGIDDTFVVVNGDVLTDLDVAAMVAMHRERGAEGTIHLTPVDDPSAYGVVELGERGRVLRFVEKPPRDQAPSNLVNAGTYVLEPSVLHRIPDGRKVSIEREVFPAMVADGTLFGMPTDDYWLDTGRPGPYLQANLDVLRGIRRRGGCPAVEPGATVDPTATLDDSLVSASAHVGPGARLVHSVVLPGGWIGAGATVERSVVMGSVGEGAALHDCVIGGEGIVAPGEVLHDVKRPEPGTP